MIGMNVELGLLLPNNRLIWHKGKNTITDYGIERMRDALIGSGNALDRGMLRPGTPIFDPHMQFRTDGNVLANVDTGFPDDADPGPVPLKLDTVYQGTKTLISNLSFSILQMYDARIVSEGALLQIARTSLNPVPPSSIANGTTIIARWTIAPNFGTLASDLPGTDALQRAIDGAVEIVNRIIGSETASNTGLIKFWKSSGSRNPYNATELSSVNVTLSEDPNNDKRLITSSFTYPAITGSSASHRYHWAELYLDRGSNARLIRLFYEDFSGIARPSATPNQTTDLIFSSA